MEREGIIRMSAKELRRVGIIHKVVAGELSQVKAASVLRLSARQVRRLVKRFKALGEWGLIHRSRGRAGNRRYHEGLKSEVMGLYREKYGDFGPTLANEKLEELEGVKLSPQTLRNWLIAEGLWQRRRKAKRPHQWRCRRECRGELVQMDGSHHDWLEGRGPKLVLMSYVDDASSEVLARFYD